MERPPILPPPTVSPLDPLRLTVVRDAVALFRKSPLAWILNALPSAILLSLATYQETACLRTLWTNMDFDLSRVPGVIEALGLNALGIALVFVTGAPAANALRKAQRGESVTVGDTLDLKGSAGQTLIVSLAMAVLIPLGYLCCYFPGLLAEGMSITANLRAADRGEWPLEAFRRSSAQAKGRFLVAAVSVHALLGILLVCSCIPLVGFLLGIPIYTIGRGLFYLRLEGEG